MTAFKSLKVNPSQHGSDQYIISPKKKYFAEDSWRWLEKLNTSPGWTILSEETILKK